MTFLAHTYYNNAFPRCLRPLALALAVLAAVLSPAGAWGRGRLNDKVENRPYADLRPWNLGFSVGVNTLGMSFHHNGFVTEQGQTWYMEQPDYSPGFCVSGLLNFRLNTYFSLRFTPGMWFGNRIIRFKDTSAADAESEPMEKQDLKSAYVVLPLDVKYSAVRLRNIRPYVVAGIMPTFDVAKKRSDFLWTKGMDFMLSVGFGCDIYLPFFKLSPELKFCFGLTDVIKHDRPDLVDDPMRLNVSNSLKKATTQMVALTFYFE